MRRYFRGSELGSRLLYSRTKLVRALIAASLLAPGLASAQPHASEVLPYTIECSATIEEAAACRTDLATFIGRRVFDRYCASCHATDAVGSSFAPPLVDRVKGMSLPAFRNVLESGYRGDAGAMPRWADIADVQRYSEPLWIYLRARAAGDLPPGPIELLPGAGVP